MYGRATFHLSMPAWAATKGFRDERCSWKKSRYFGHGNDLALPGSPDIAPLPTAEDQPGADAQEHRHARRFSGRRCVDPLDRRSDRPFGHHRRVHRRCGVRDRSHRAGIRGRVAGGDHQRRTAGHHRLVPGRQGIAHRGGRRPAGLPGCAARRCAADGLRAARVRQHEGLSEPQPEPGRHGVLVEAARHQPESDHLVHRRHQGADRAGGGGQRLRRHHLPAGARRAGLHRPEPQRRDPGHDRRWPGAADRRLRGAQRLSRRWRLPGLQARRRPGACHRVFQAGCRALLRADPALPSLLAGSRQDHLPGS